MSIKKRIVVIAGIGEYTPHEKKEIFECRDAVIAALRTAGYDAVNLEIYEEDFEENPFSVIPALSKLTPDCVFNLFEGFGGNSTAEVEFARILEEENIPFTGNGSAALETCLNKDKAKKILVDNGIDVPPGIFIKEISDLEDHNTDFPVFVKPAFQDASLGIDELSLVSDTFELDRAVRSKLRDFPRGLMVEDFMPGREYNAGFLGDYPYELVGVSVLEYEYTSDCVNYLNYRSKWKSRAVEYKKLVPSVLDREDERHRQDAVEISRKAASVLGCSRYFRVDLREKSGRLYVLDVNPNPDISPGSGLIRQAERSDLSYADVIVKITENALQVE